MRGAKWTAAHAFTREIGSDIEHIHGRIETHLTNVY